MLIKMVITDETKWVAWGQCKVLQLFGANNNASDDRYIQLHESPAVLNGDVPAVASLYAPAAAPFAWTFETPVQLSELLIAISSTQANYTAVTNTGLDLTAVVETDFPVTSATTLSGDIGTTNTGGDSEIWNESAGPKRLLRLDCYNNSGVNTFIHIFCRNLASLTEDNYSLLSYPIDDGEAIKRTFGRGGLEPLIVDAAGVTRDGCVVMTCAGGELATHSFDNGLTNFYIRAIYE